MARSSRPDRAGCSCSGRGSSAGTTNPRMRALARAARIMLLSAAAPQLHDSFEISANGARDGLDWVEVKPRSAEADFSRAALGFAGDRLARMVVNDRLGQTVA